MEHYVQQQQASTTAEEDCCSFSSSRTAGNHAVTSTIGSFSQSKDLTSSSHCAYIMMDEDEDSSSIENVNIQILSVPLWIESSTFDQTQDKTLIFMYSRALLISPGHHDREFITGIVLYNMAMVNHARAIEQGRSKVLEIAFSFTVWPRVFSGEVARLVPTTTALIGSLVQYVAHSLCAA